MYAELAPGSVFASRFLIVRRLAEGGMGAVYEAEQLSTRRKRALKVMLPHIAADPTFRQRFLQEAQVGALANSPHIVEVIDAGIDDATAMPWLTMEFLEGETLASAIEHGTLSQMGAMGVIQELGNALASAHAVGLVHRDVKPDNVFLARIGGRCLPVVKLLDFGIAKIVSDAKATKTAAIGTPLFMAPEQMVNNGRISPATDVWALGLTAFHALTGRHYWRSGNATDRAAMMIANEVMSSTLERASARACEHGVALPVGFDDWFATCVARDASARFHDAAAAVASFASLATLAAPAVVRHPQTAPMTLPQTEPMRHPQTEPVPPDAPERVGGVPVASAVRQPPRPATSRRHAVLLVAAGATVVGATVLIIATRDGTSPTKEVAAGPPSAPVVSDAVHTSTTTVSAGKSDAPTNNSSTMADKPPFPSAQVATAGPASLPEPTIKTAPPTTPAPEPTIKEGLGPFDSVAARKSLGEVKHKLCCVAGPPWCAPGKFSVVFSPTGHVSNAYGYAPGNWDQSCLTKAFRNAKPIRAFDGPEQTLKVSIDPP